MEKVAQFKLLFREQLVCPHRFPLARLGLEVSFNRLGTSTASHLDSHALSLLVWDHDCWKLYMIPSLEIWYHCFIVDTIGIILFKKYLCI